MDAAQILLTLSVTVGVATIAATIINNKKNQLQKKSTAIANSSQSNLSVIDLIDKSIVQARASKLTRYAINVEFAKLLNEAAQRLNQQSEKCLGAHELALECYKTAELIRNLVEDVAYSQLGEQFYKELAVTHVIANERAKRIMQYTCENCRTASTLARCIRAYVMCDIKGDVFKNYKVMQDIRMAIDQHQAYRKIEK